MTIDQLIGILRRPDAPQVCIDSRAVRPGDVFVAIKGTHQDGHQFIDQAIQNGARFIVYQDRPASQDGRAVWVRVDDTVGVAAMLAQARFDWPASRLINTAVTGTNGKTTVCFLVRGCLQNAGLRCGLIGTVQYNTGLRTNRAELTTPDALTIARLQAEMVQAGCTHMVMEASSHALSQGRCKGIQFTAAGFTNLTRDHLDYHKDIEAYRAAKAVLFEDLAGDATAVLNAECPHARFMAERTKARCLWYAIEANADLQAKIIAMDSHGTRYAMCYQGKEVTVYSPLLGRHNVSNHLAAAGLCLALGLDLEQIRLGLESVHCIPGRLERLSWPGPFSVIVDFAHTDDALKNVLSTLRPICRGRIILVFGCGGDRDKGKRPRMARIAQEMADLLVITSDNPRTEDPNTIIQQILDGLIDPDPSKVHIDPDRKEAIGWAISQARKADVVLIAGKGHEDYQIIGTTKYPFSDQQVAIEYLGGLNKDDPNTPR